jgi:hypothetical protein|tara:strand:- start:196 stop:348 length:153 start_codon:yes stop_codon:yes gene_type:complete
MDGKNKMAHENALMALKEACRGLGGFEWQEICAISEKNKLRFLKPSFNRF